jgi:hypothetical protein
MYQIPAFVLGSSILGRSDSVESAAQRRSSKRRSYATAILVFIAHLVVCTAFYTLYEGWHVSKAMYFVIDTTTSVGKLWAKASLLLDSKSFKHCPYSIMQVSATCGLQMTIPGPSLYILCWVACASCLAVSQR